MVTRMASTREWLGVQFSPLFRRSHKTSVRDAIRTALAAAQELLDPVAYARMEAELDTLAETLPRAEARGDRPTWCFGRA